MLGLTSSQTIQGQNHASVCGFTVWLPSITIPKKKLRDPAILSLSLSLVNIWLVSEICPFIVLFYDTFVFQNIITIVSEVKYFGCIILSGVLYQYESQIYTCHRTICHVHVQHRTLRVDFSEGLIAWFFLLPFFWAWVFFLSYIYS